jgi:glycosyltransferase involved in cell wall biosynthesis
VAFLPDWPDNPYQELLATALAGHGVQVDALPRQRWFAARVLRTRRHVVHLHAPDHFVVYSPATAVALLKLLAFSAQLVMLRLVGVRLVWTLHDLVNHEGQYVRLDRLCRRLTGKLSHAVIVHCAYARERAIADFGIPARKLWLIPHGHYVGRYPAPHPGREAMRAELGIPDRALVFLFLGNLRQHKGVASLLDAFRALDHEETRLVIRGKPFTESLAGALRERARHLARVDLQLGFVPDAEVSRYLATADVVVCPHESVLSSGSLALAMSFGRACIAPRLGCLPEMLAPDGGFTYEPHRPEGLLGALRQAVDRRDELEAMGRRNLERIRREDWAAIATQTRAVYRAHLDAAVRDGAQVEGPMAGTGSGSSG